MKRGTLVIVSSPSGAGKTTLTRMLMEEFSSLEFSVSYTTRPKRPKEKDGRDYWFVSRESFDEMARSGEFAEWAKVHNNYYGTGKIAVERALNEGRYVVFDVDWQGGRELSRQWPEDSLKIFILPPSLRALELRLRSRASDSEEVIAARLAKAKEELAHFEEYDHLIINEDLAQAYQKLRAIFLARTGGDPQDELVAETLSQEVRQFAQSLLA